MQCFHIIQERHATQTDTHATQTDTLRDNNSLKPCMKQVFTAVFIRAAGGVFRRHKRENTCGDAGEAN